MTRIKNSTWQKIATRLVAISRRLINCRGKTMTLTAMSRGPTHRQRCGSFGNWIDPLGAPQSRVDQRRRVADKVEFADKKVSCRGLATRALINGSSHSVRE